MKKIVLAFLFVLFALPVRADEYAVTDSGKDVLLKADGTWVFVGSGQGSDPAAPDWAYEVIRTTASGVPHLSKCPDPKCGRMTAKEAALLNLKYQLLERVLKLELDGKTVVLDAGLGKVLEGFKVRNTTYDADNNCEVFGELRLFDVYKYLKARKLRSQ